MKRLIALCIGGFSIVAVFSLSGDTLSGSWSGTLTQNKPAETYQVRLQLSGSSGSSDYSSLGCGGTLTLQGQQGSTFTYRESMTYGQDKCIDGCTVSVSPGTNAATVHYTETCRGGIIADGTLSGSGNLASGGSCLSPGSIRTTDGFVYWNFRNSCDKEVLVSVCAQYANGNNNILATNVSAHDSADINLGSSSQPTAKLTWKEGGGIRCPQ
jgi:hypothetical protein